MMSTEISAQPSISSTTSASIVEVEATTEETLFKLQRPPSLEDDQDGLEQDTEDKLMMTEYDEDNVIVIDLTEEKRNSASVKKSSSVDEATSNSIRPRAMFDLSNLNGDNNDLDHTLDDEDEDEDDAASETYEVTNEETTIIEEAAASRVCGLLPPVMPLRNHNSTEAILTTQSPSKRPSEAYHHNHDCRGPPRLTRRAQTVSIPDLEAKNGLNGNSFHDLHHHHHHHHQNNLWRDTDTTTTTTTDDETLSKQRQHRKNRKQKAASANSTSSAADITVLKLNRRSASCRRAVEVSRPSTTTFNLMSMSMIGNSLGGAYGEPDSYERRRKARSNDFLDRIDISVLSTRSANTSTHATKRKASPKMNRIERGLFLGSLEAATDVILLESNAITHIVTVDSVPLPRKITSMMPRIAILHLQITDLPEEDLLSHFHASNAFIDEGLSKEGAVLVHCYRGRSRSATVVAAFLMQKHGHSADRAIAKVKAKREIIQPHDQFLAQLKLYENMDFTLDTENLQYKMFKLHVASEKMRKAKILFRDILDEVIDPDPTGGLPGSAASMAAAAAKSRYPMVYKCKKCRRTLATAFNLLPHVQDECPVWTASKWSLPAEDVLEAASESGLQLCSASLFINPVKWMEPEIKQNLAGRLYCPNCQARVGEYSWIKGQNCGGCEAKVNPAFSLDVTEIIFRTKNRFLQSTQREPVVV